MIITQKPELGRYMTFELSKEKPVHGWFWYKEGYAPEIVEWAIADYAKTRNSKPGTILDPFCGVGTTLLTAKEKGIESVGVDASPLAVFASKTKCDDYEKTDLEGALAFLSKSTTKTKNENPKTNKLERSANSDVSERNASELSGSSGGFGGGRKRGGSERNGSSSGFGLEFGLDWEFELFSPRAAFPKRNYNEILALREAIEQEEGRVRNILLLALLSILPQASIVMKDGGVLKIDKNKRALPAKEIFRRKVKRMVRELESRPQGHSPSVFLGDARALDIESESMDAVITSPPYLNNIDYSKIYGLELSLLHMSAAEAEEVRMRAVRSFIRTGRLETGNRMLETALPPEVGDIGLRIPIIGTYFRDMEMCMAEMARVLKDGGSAYIVVSNSVIHETHVLVDEIFGQMGERIGFRDVEVVVGAERIADVRPQKVRTRESVVVLRK